MDGGLLLEGLEKRHSLLAHGSILHLVLLVCWVTFASMETTWGSSQPMVGGVVPAHLRSCNLPFCFPSHPVVTRRRLGVPRKHELAQLSFLRLKSPFIGSVTPLLLPHPGTQLQLSVPRVTQPVLCAPNHASFLGEPSLWASHPRITKWFSD